MQQGKGKAASKATRNEQRDAALGSKKIYSSPILEHYGDLETLTKGNGNGTGEGSGGPMSMTCWIAEVLYGVQDHRTHLLRKWLNTVYCRTVPGFVVVALYRAFGMRVAGWARRSARLRRILAVPFDAGIAAALRHYTLAARCSAWLRRILAVPFDAGVSAAQRHYTLAGR